jgi:penicillin-binding protein 2
VIRKLEQKFEKLVSDRFLVLGILFACLLLVLFGRLFYVQIVNGENYRNQFTYKVQKTVKTNGIRGNIYDTNGKLLAYDKLVYSVSYQNDNAFATLATKNGTSENYEKNKVIYSVIKILESNKDTIQSEIPIEITGKGKFRFTEKGSKLERFKRDAFGIGTATSDLSASELKLRKQQLNASAKEVFEYLRSGKLGSAGVGKMFDIDKKYSDADALKIMSVRYNAYQSRYTQYVKITVSNNISKRSLAAVEENLGDLPGIDVTTKSMRMYNCSEAMSHVIGYTGTINTSELKEYNKGKKETDADYYSSDEIVGKSGIEKQLESYLHGNGGTQTLVVNNIGKIIDVSKTKEASTGNNVTLTIDSELQEYAYNLLERRIAGIVLSKLTDSKEKGSGDNVMIPFVDVFYSLISNKVVDISMLNAEDATAYEKSVYKKIQELKKDDIDKIVNSIQTSTKAYKKESQKIQDYDDYVYKLLTNNKVLVSSSIDKKNKTYQKWKNEKIGLGEFLRYAINQEWIDISYLNVDSKYSDTEDIMKALMDYVSKMLLEDEDFDSTVCEENIYTGDLSSRSICLLLYEQGILSKKKDSDYASLKSGSMSAKTFMRTKISKLDITPAQLGLDPCSGSIVITDPHTGKVKAMVSYPGYDSNRLSNGTDNQYYIQLSNSSSTPLYNQVLNHKTAPGSTFKPVTSIAALNENVITTSTQIKDNGIFTKISPAAKCWIYPNNHGKVNVSGAIEVSCNYFFYEVGYLMGTTKSGSYSSKQGLEMLKKYATELGLNKKSGIELSELSPEVSDESSVRSAIGQGTNSFTPSQIANYNTTLASKGSVYDLSIMDKITTTKGKTIKKYGTKKIRQIKLADSSYWNAVWDGMKRVVSGKNSSIKSIYSNLGVTVAGKTGTAQENKNRPNHALFISFGPYSDPEIAVTTVIPYGYTSSNAAATAKDVYKYYFASKKKKKALQKDNTVKSPASTGSAGD